MMINLHKIFSYSQKILINSKYLTKYCSWLNILCQSWHNADVTVCREYKLASFNWCCQLLPCFDGELNLIRWWKMFILSALSNIRTWNQASHDPKTQPSCKLVALSCSNMWKTSYPHRHVNAIAFHAFCKCNCKTSKICHKRTRFFTIGAG